MSNLGIIILIASVQTAILTLIFQFIANSIIKELKPNGGSTIRDIMDRLEKTALTMQASVQRLEQGQGAMKATGERLEEAGAQVAHELAEAQSRASEVAGGAPGAAADAAVLPANNLPKKPIEVTVVNPITDPVNTEVGNSDDKPVPTRATIERKQERLDQAQEKLDKEKELIEHPPNDAT